MTKNRTAVSVKLAVYSNLESSLENWEPQPNVDWKTEDPWMAILVEELEKSFRHFAKETGRLTRLVQPKKKCHIPSEGFNCLVTLRMDKVERAFRTYMRRKDELLNYIQATSWKVQLHNAGKRTFLRLPVPTGCDQSNAGEARLQFADAIAHQRCTADRSRPGKRASESSATR